MSQLVSNPYKLPSTNPTAFNHPRGKGNEVEQEHISEAMFYGAAFAIGCAAAVCRMVHERSHRDNRDLVAISVQGGLWSFGVVSIFGYFYPGFVASYWPGLGVASFIGLGGKEQDKYLRIILDHIFAFICRKLGIPTNGGKDEQPKE